VSLSSYKLVEGDSKNLQCDLDGPSHVAKSDG
jgi:hypothetical protein